MRRQIKWMFIFCVLLIANLPLVANDYTLVSNGTPACSIVISNNATRSAQFAAFELQWHLKQITGATIPIIDDQSSPSGILILVGESQYTTALGYSNQNFESQQYTIAQATDKIILMGKDDSATDTVLYDMDNLHRNDCYKSWPGIFEERGTMHAVYDFLELYCDVRWFNPTESGTVLPQAPTLTVQVSDVLRKPAFSYRDVIGKINPDLYDAKVVLWDDDSTEFSEWLIVAYPDIHATYTPGTMNYIVARRSRIQLFRLRMREGGEPNMCNHSFYGYYDRFWEYNPSKPYLWVEQMVNYFAQGYTGLPPQLCYTNTVLINQVIQDAEDYFDGVKTGDDFGLYWCDLPNPFPVEPMDNKSMCLCSTCQEKITNSVLGDVPYFSKGIHSEYWFNFVNQIANGIAINYPNESLVTLAYGSHAYPPESFNLAPNVKVQFCFTWNRAPYLLTEYNHEWSLLTDWAQKVSGRLYLWLYPNIPRERAMIQNFYCFPGFYAHTLGTQFLSFQQLGIKGMAFCGWGQEVEAYVSYKLMDDPTRSVDDLLEDYFDRLYGPAGDALKQFYLMVESIYCDPNNYVEGDRHQTARMAWWQLGTPDRMETLRLLMEDAKNATGLTAIQSHRVTLFEKGVWNYMQAGVMQDGSVFSEEIQASNVLFMLCNDGNTAQNGLDADYASGSGIAISTTGVSLKSGKYGTGVWFPENTSANVSLQFDAANNIHNDKGTLEFWWIPDKPASEMSGISYRLLNVRNTDGSRFMDISYINEKIIMFSNTFWAGAQISVSLKDFVAGEPIHIAFTWDNTHGVRLFVNGEHNDLPNSSTTWDANSHTQSIIYVGSSMFGTALNATGVIDGLLISSEIEYDHDFWVHSVPWREPLFLVHFDGNTSHNGLDADYAVGNGAAIFATGVSLNAGKYGAGALFTEDTSANVSLQFDATNNIHNDKGTLEFWWIPDKPASEMSGISYRLLNVRNTDGSRFMDISYLNEKIIMFSNTFWAGAQISVSLKDFVAGEPIHIAFTWDNTHGVRLFVNGEHNDLPNSSTTWDANSHTQSIIYVGSSMFGTALNAAGVIDDLRITGKVEYNEGFTPPARSHTTITLGD